LHVLKLLKNVQSEPKLNSSNCLNFAFNKVVFYLLSAIFIIFFYLPFAKVRLLILTEYFFSVKLRPSLVKVVQAYEANVAHYFYYI